MRPPLALIVPALISVAAVLSGCDRIADLDKFKLVSSPSGDLYRLEVSTGKVHRIVGEALVPVSDNNRLKLQVGAIYILENGVTMKYVGDGKFESFKSDIVTLEEYLRTPGAKEKLEEDIKTANPKK